MTLDPTQLPDDITALKAMLIATAKRAHDAETRASTLDAEIENLKLTIAKPRHDKFGSSVMPEACVPHDAGEAARSAGAAAG
jgi:hypothetical protein